MEPAPYIPTRKEIFALRALEHALGWEGRASVSKLPSAEDYSERLSSARSSAGLGDLIAPDWQARLIRAALLKLKKAKALR